MKQYAAGEHRGKSNTDKGEKVMCQTREGIEQRGKRSSKGLFQKRQNRG